MKPTEQYASHTGEERYEVKLTYGPDEVEKITRLTRDGQVVVDTIHLIYTRKIGQRWQRYTNGRHGSRVEGNEKVAYGMGAVGPRRTRQVFTSTRGEICRWAEVLPGLISAIEDVEIGLPK